METGPAFTNTELTFKGTIDDLRRFLDDLEYVLPKGRVGAIATSEGEVRSVYWDNLLRGVSVRAYRDGGHSRLRVSVINDDRWPEAKEWWKRLHSDMAAHDLIELGSEATETTIEKLIFKGVPEDFRRFVLDLEWAQLTVGGAHWGPGMEILDLLVYSKSTGVKINAEKAGRHSWLNVTVPDDRPEAKKLWERFYCDIVADGLIELKPEAVPNGNGNHLCDPLPEIWPHPLKDRRESVRRMKLSGQYRDFDIAHELKTSIDNVKQDIKLLRRKGLMPKSH